MNDALRHYTCPMPRQVIDDLFFYKASDPETAVVVLVGSGVTESRRAIVAIGSVENYLLPAFYRDCLGPAVLQK